MGACFTAKVAKELSNAWQCEDPGAAEVARGGHRPQFECSYPNKARCTIHPNCEWCWVLRAGKRAGGRCYTHEQGNILPQKEYVCVRTPP